MPDKITPQVLSLARDMVRAQLRLWDASTEMEALPELMSCSSSEHIESLCIGIDNAEQVSDATLRELVADLMAETAR